MDLAHIAEAFNFMIAKEASTKDKLAGWGINLTAWGLDLMKFEARQMGFHSQYF
jgi:hypothetical protein